MLQVSKLEKSYTTQVLFKDCSFALSRGERLGLVGRNGHGKSTLFRMIIGEETPDDGLIAVPRHYRVGHLQQHLDFTGKTIVEEGCLGLPADEKDFVYKVEAILFGLGFTEKDLDRPPSDFSGGYQIRLNLAKLLVSEPDLLLLDEPTNYLDIVSVRWLQRFLQAWRNELMIITHDRQFMDSVTTHTMAIHRQKVRKVTGGTEKLYDQLLLEEEIHEKTRLNEEKKIKKVERFIERFRAQAGKAASVQSRVKQLKRKPKLEELSNIQSLDFAFSQAAFPTRIMLELSQVSFAYPGGPTLLDKVDITIDKGDRIGVIGMNGKGKSTLLKLMARELKPLSGRITSHDATRVGFFGQTNIDRLERSFSVEDEILSANPNLGRTAVRSICGVMMFSGDDATKKVEVLSGGERSRTLLGKILAQPSNLLLLDEPTSHLDMDSIEALVDAIDSYEGAVVMVTHSEMMLEVLATRLIYFQGGGVGVFDGTYPEFLERIGWDDEQYIY